MRAGASQIPLSLVGEGVGGEGVGAGEHGHVSCYGANYHTSPSLPLYPKWMLPFPGVGEKRDDCKTGFAKKMVCEKDQEHPAVQIGLRTCGRQECPACWGTWALRGADRAGSRLEGFAKAIRTRYRPRHIILSMSDGDAAYYLDRYEDDGDRLYKALKKEFLGRAERVGIKGGAMVIHLYRVDHIAQNGDSATNLKTWENVRKTGRWRDIVRYSPHAHIIGYGYLHKPEKGEFTYKNKGILKTRDDIERVAYYALSHAALPSKGHAITYFGACGYNKLRVTLHFSASVPLKCPVCGACMVYEGTNFVHLVKTDQSDFNYVGPPIKWYG